MPSRDPAEITNPIVRLETDVLRYTPYRGWEIVLVTFPSTTHRDVVVPHNLTVDTPEAVNYQILQTNCPQSIYHAPTSLWTHHSIRLRSSVAGGQAVVLLAVSKSNNPKLSYFDINSLPTTVSIPSPTTEGEMLVARRESSQNTLDHWYDGGSLRPIHHPRAASGGVKYWADGGVFEGLGDVSVLSWQRLTPGPERATLTMQAGIPTWIIPTTIVTPVIPPPTVEQPAPVPEVPPAAKAVARAEGAFDRLTYSASTAVRFPSVVTDTDGMRSWTGTPPSGVTSGAFKIPRAGTYTITVYVMVSDPDEDPTMDYFVTLRKTTPAGAQTVLGTSNTNVMEVDPGDVTVSATVYLEAGDFLEAHRGGNLVNNNSSIQPTSYFSVREV